MDLRIFCNSIALVDRHAQVDFGLNTPAGYNMLRLLLPVEEATANFKPGAWYTLAIAEAGAGAVPAAPPEIPAGIGTVGAPAAPGAQAGTATTPPPAANVAVPPGTPPAEANDGSGSSA